ncbi:hypothetical protein P152DRAFT_142909 [Eremomyces bilateralis CBS 781.70]|uniref:Myb-like domain-containing protein n=1 Tax=Eremomyces bilateralis CBS 781.70 TaxID=1392243 RepID=A0A6G1FW31_9PEZI|nr:uncharacterized protein P152DRAFT_142909 [Eremomyces bilateralis CBS 781.70]KAF1809902.1 hypothetical protein P152DRAFT_142909 [Eremomyces bilateralis CBS 781.70]
MEPRISALVGSPLLIERGNAEILLPSTIFNPQSAANPLSLPLPVQPHHINHDPNIAQTAFGVGSRHESRLPLAPITQPPSSNTTFQTPPTFDIAPSTAQAAHLSHQTKPTSSKASLPLDSVLNAEDASVHAPRKRRKISVSNEAHPSNAQHPAVLELPKPPQPKKSVRRQRLAPILPGLYQPPPDAGLFPSISVTDEGRLKKNAGSLRGGHDNDGARGTAIKLPGEASIAPIRPLTQNHASSETTTSIKPAGSPAKVSAEGQGQPVVEENGNPPSTRVNAVERGNKAKQKRKWTDQETEDLLKGVAKLGIGRWAKILQCPDYTFNGRSAVDLKDRFRTCCPDDYKKSKVKDHDASSKPDRRGRREDTAATKHPKSRSNGEETRQTISLPPKRPKRLNCDRKDPTDLAAMGIDQPFFKVARRELTPFTDEEDALLLKGFEKHGPQWNRIRDDAEFTVLASRARLDLRDRFRVKYPEHFARSRKTRVSEEQPMDHHKSATELAATDPTLQPARQQSGALSVTEAQDPTLKAPSRTVTAVGNLLEDFLSDFDDDFTIDEYPTSITLSRRIFEEAPTSQRAPKPTPAISGPWCTYIPDSTLSSSTNLPIENLHIDPLKTIIPSSSSWPSYSTSMTAGNGGGNPYSIPPSLSLNPSPSSSSILNSLIMPPPAPSRSHHASLPQPLPSAMSAPHNPMTSSTLAGVGGPLSMLPPSLSGILTVDSSIMTGSGNAKHTLPQPGMTLPRPAELLNGYVGDSWQF